MATCKGEEWQDFVESPVAITINREAVRCNRTALLFNIELKIVARRIVKVLPQAEVSLGRRY